MADADPFAQYIAPEPKAAGDDPFAAYVAPEAPASAAPPPAAPAQPSRWERAKAALGSAGSAIAQPFEEMGRSALEANRTVANAIVHPVDTYRSLAANPGASLREGMRGVNDNIPLANRAVQAMGGPPADSPEDAAASPSARVFGNLAGLPAAGAVGGIAGKVVETAVPAIGRAVKAVGEGAQNRQVDRTLENLEMKTGKRTRAGIRQGVVEDAVRDDPALRAAAGSDTKVAQATQAMKQRAAADLGRIYGAHPEVGDIGEAITRMDSRIAELRQGTSSDAAVANQLQGIRDELNNRMGARDTIKTTDLRAEQTDYQKKGYGKSMPGDEAASARIAANREASKAVGDAVIKNVTGMDYEAARAAAAASPNSEAARLLKANDTIAAANKIEAGVADRGARVQPKEGLAGRLYEMGKEIKHSPTGYALSKVPQAAAGALNAGDNLLARAAGSRFPARAGTAAAPSPLAVNAARLAGEWAPGGGAPAPQAPTSNPAAVAMLIRAARSGATRQELHAQAEQAGVPVELADNIAQQSGL